MASVDIINDKSDLLLCLKVTCDCGNTWETKKKTKPLGAVAILPCDRCLKKYAFCATYMFGPEDQIRAFLDRAIEDQKDEHKGAKDDHSIPPPAPPKSEMVRP